MLGNLLKQILIWGFLLFMVSRFLLYLLAALFTLIGLTTVAGLLSALFVALFAGLAGYFSIRSLSNSNNINKLFTPLIVGFGIIIISQLFNAIFSFILLRQFDFGYSIGILRLITGIIGGYIAAMKTAPNSTSSIPK